MLKIVYQSGPDGKTIARVLVDRGPYSGKIFKIKEGENTVGNSSEDNIYLPLSQIKGRHFSVIFRDDNLSLVEKNGKILLNGERLEGREAALKHGDRIDFLEVSNFKESGGAGISPSNDGLIDEERGTKSEIFLKSEKIESPKEELQNIKSWLDSSPSVGGEREEGGEVRGGESERCQWPEKKLEILLAVSKALSRPEPLENKLTRILEILFETMEIERAAILILPDKAQVRDDSPLEKFGRWEFSQSAYLHRSGSRQKMNLSSTIINKVLDEEVAVITQDAMSEEWLDGAKSVFTHTIRTCICTPLKTSSGTLGVLYADSSKVRNPFTKEDFDFFTAFSSQAAWAIENSRLLKLALERERLKYDLQLARKIQSSLFPQRDISLDRCEITGQCRMMDVVGGDYYDYFFLSPHRILLAMGDVSGHGISAALLMTIVRSALRSSARDLNTPSSLLYRIDQVIAEDIMPKMFITMLVGILDLNRESLVLSTAGHPPPLFFSAEEGTAIDTVNLKVGPPLGMSKWAKIKPNYSDTTLNLRADSGILFYTDGVIETQNVEEREFGISGLIKVLKKLRRNPPKKIVARIFDELELFRNCRRQRDDNTLMLLYWRGKSTSDKETPHPSSSE